MRFGRTYLYRGTAVAGAVGLTVALLTGSSLASDARSQADADELRSVAQSPGALVTVREGDSVESFGSGSTELNAQHTPTSDHQFRVASSTKMFVATVLLQLVDEGKLDLDTPIGEYLPGLVTGPGIDDSVITVRQLMRHTSGLPDVTNADVDDPDLQANPPTPEQMVARTLDDGAVSEPGKELHYSNPGYMVLGLLVEKLTGQRLGTAFDERVIRPLGLTNTSYAYAGDKTIEGPHFRGYAGPPFWMSDLTEYEPGVFGPSGALISSGSDLTKFLDGLLGGELMSDASLAEMRESFDDMGYGLGLSEVKLSCGLAWGHSGRLPGYWSLALSDGDRSVFTAVNYSENYEASGEVMMRIAESEICGTDGSVGTPRMDGFLDQTPVSGIAKETTR